MIYWGFYFCTYKNTYKNKGNPKMESPHVNCAKHIPKFGNMILTKKVLCIWSMLCKGIKYYCYCKGIITSSSQSSVTVIENGF